MNRSNLFGASAGLPVPLKALMQGRITLAEMRSLRPLPENAQKLIDDAVVRVGLDRLVIVSDFMAEGLTMNLGQDFWGITQLQWDMISETGTPRRTMEPLARGEYSIPDRTPAVLPIYLTWDDFELGIRTMRASERGGGPPLDTSIIEQKTRRVNEAIEDAMINGAGITSAGYTTPGLLTAPNVNAYLYEGTGGATTAWDHASKTGQEIVNDVLAMAALAEAQRRYGPYNLYIPTSYGNALNKNFSDGVTTFDMTVRARLEQMVFGGRNLRIRVADQLPANRTILVQMTSDVADVIVGQEPTVINWEHPSGLQEFWLVLACIVPRVKTTYTNQSGIVTGNV